MIRSNKRDQLSHRGSALVLPDSHASTHCHEQVGVGTYLDAQRDEGRARAQLHHAAGHDVCVHNRGGAQGAAQFE